MAGESDEKMVPEKDLINIKTALGTKVDKLEGEKAAIQAQLDSAAGELAKLQEAKAQVETRLKKLEEGSTGDSAKAAQLEKELGEAKAEAEALRKGVTENLVGQLKAAGMPEAELAGKSLSELQIMHKTLQIVKPGSQSFDRGGTGGGQPMPVGGRAKIAEGIKQLNL